MTGAEVIVFIQGTTFSGWHLDHSDILSSGVASQGIYNLING